MSKNSSGGDSSLGLEEGDESGEGRQLYSQTHWGWGAVGGEYPTGGVPPQLVESKSLPTSPCPSMPGFAARPRSRRLCQALGG